MNKNAPITKITRPLVKGILPRKRLYRMLDSERDKPVIWVTGPAGSGKTTLITSYLDARKLPCLWYNVDARDGDVATFFYYMGLAAKKAAPRKRKPLPLLTPEYLPGLPTFTLRYFEELYSSLKPPFSIVFDNYQDAPLESNLHEVVRGGLDIAPKGIKIFLLSRSGPPAVMSCLRAEEKMKVLDWDDIRFTLEESGELLRLKGERKIPVAALKMLHKQVDGWAAGLVLMMETLKKQEDESPSAVTHTPQEVFDYFAGELFNKTDDEKKTFLLKSSFLPNMTMPMTEQLTGAGNADRILSGLKQSNFFTTASSGGVYQYHPLFRAFLQFQARQRFSKEEVRSILLEAAAILKKNGHAEDAAGSLMEAGEWNELVCLILEQAPQLTGQGRYRMLEAWLAGLPADLLNSVSWLCFWLGICRMPFDPSDSRSRLEAAFGLFKSEKNPAGLFLSCSAIIDTFIFELAVFSPMGRWIKEMDDLLKQHKELPSKEIELRVTFSMFCALMFNQPYRDDLPQWEGRLNELMHNCRDVNQRMLLGSWLVLYGSWIGDYTKYQSILLQLAPLISRHEITPTTKILWHMTEAIYQWGTADFDKCEQSIAKGIETGNATGVHVFDAMLYSQGIYGALISGNIEASAEYLKKMTLTTDLAKPWLSGHHNYHRAWDAFSRGELAVSLACSRTAHAAQADTGWYFSRGLTAALLAQVLFETGDHAGAARYLAEEKEIGASMKSLFLEFNSLMLEAYFSFASKTTEAKAIGLTVLKRAMELGGKANLMNLQGLKRSTSAFLCVKAMEAGIEMEYVRRLISAHRLMPEEPPLHIENWPWPLKVYAFGRFEIFKDGSRLLFSGKIQRKPLDMLKLLIAHGGKDLRDELITEALWPEADGDAAYQSYETTLYRLRRMIGVDNAILRQEGCLTLDPRYWWTDAWAFEWMLETNHCEKALALYRGRFLDGDGEKQWLVPMRERLRSKFLRATTGMGETYEQSEQWDKALECYRKALEADSLAEEFYQRLMTCYQRLGRRAEALAVYNRCRDVLSKVLGIGPSHKTEELYLAIRNK